MPEIKFGNPWTNEKLVCPLIKKGGKPLICHLFFLFLWQFLFPSITFSLSFVCEWNPSTYFLYGPFLFFLLFSLADDMDKGHNEVNPPPIHMRWPHMQADQVRGLSLREIGGGFTRHNRAPSIRAACYAVAKPSTMVQKMQNIKKLRGHRNAVYCGKLLIHVSHS